ncbi:ATP-dependent RNA helicase [Cryptotrichosporon argae]
MPMIKTSRSVSGKTAKRGMAPPVAASKKRNVDAGELRWRAVPTSGVGMDEGGGMLELEELDGVGIEWEEVAGRKVARFVADEQAIELAGELADGEAADDGEEWAGIVENDAASGEDAASEDAASEEEEAGEGLPSFAGVELEDMVDDDDFDDSTLPAWSTVDLAPALKRGLAAAGFTTPTPIQAQAIPLGLEGRDVVGVAQTGSGKTLAYALPILHHLLSSLAPAPAATSSTSTRRPLTALIICPTRELALQVTDHLSALLSAALPRLPGEPPRISVGAVVGGLSAQKQRRVLDRGCDVLVATPGRLWDLLKADDDLAASIRLLRFLVLDEADRMVETGHFAELSSIVALTQRAVDAVGTAEADAALFDAAGTALTRARARDDMQTLVFSATMSKDMQVNLRKRRRREVKGSTLEDLVDKLDFRDPAPAVVDLAPSASLASSIRESFYPCVTTDKDLYLYYFLLRYPARTLVFVNSIDTLRRLVPLLATLGLAVHPLHSQLQQKQRLKNLDRFKRDKTAVLVATDVAARGIDVQDVEHVVHFDVPRAADTYIHRSGRTARADKDGFVLALVGAEERGNWRALLRAVKRDPPELPVETSFLAQLRARLALAKRIEKAAHTTSKAAHDRKWLLDAAKAMDVDVDESLLSDKEDADAPFSRAGPSSSSAVLGLRAELAALLAKPLLARGVSTRYPTAGVVGVVDQVLRGREGLLGAGEGRAFDEVRQKGRDNGREAKAAVADEDEEDGNDSAGEKDGKSARAKPVKPGKAKAAQARTEDTASAALNMARKTKRGRSAQIAKRILG